MKGRKRTWTESQLREAAAQCTSVRQVLVVLGLAPAGGNYAQIKRYLQEYLISTQHFTGRGWRKGKRGGGKPVRSLTEILKKGSTYQSYKLKHRLLKAGVLQEKCELCGWCEVSEDGRIPVELDHVNGNRHDNKLENLRVLCPNCHSLQPTHRGLNSHKKAGMAEW